MTPTNDVIIKKFFWINNDLYYNDILILKLEYDKKRMMYKIRKSLIWYSGLWILVDDIKFIKKLDDMKKEIEKSIYSFAKSFILYYEQNQR